MSGSPVAIVTGGAQGIGAAICAELLKNGYRVCIADIQESKAEEFAEAQQQIYGKENVIAIGCDVSKESDYTNVFEKMLEKFKRIDVLVNNAGIVDEESPRKCLEVNLLGPLIGCHTALKYMGKSNGGNGGVVINTASLAGFVPATTVPAYTASKHGIIGLTRSFGLPLHFDKDGIVFAALCPSLVNTTIIKPMIKNINSTKESDMPFKFVSIELVAKGVLKILEDKINGSTLIVIPSGYHYLILDERLKKLILDDVK
ncbi:15-hydroxyprostaglandin dehydrogenase [NAD(+)] like protein [Argiope bruennichi]|uniref:15-hydroxyprostaglandin dehydrogenase [NAD(+)] n=1 Tax=Argiope bruennichi TaxID=94029 RepID=A0A8T0EVX0_ARGBR|nr:15-hydroxyprostaglandin dehydrogenase [NAD(+)] like protein [Argiope bruennichi]